MESLITIIGKKHARQLKTGLLGISSLALVKLDEAAVSMLLKSHSDWGADRYSVQERLYEATDFLFYSLHCVTLLSTLLALSMSGFIRCLNPYKRPGKVTEFFSRHGLALTIVLTIMSGILVKEEYGAIDRIRNTDETCEAPAAGRDHILSGWLVLGLILSAEGAIISMAAWCAGQKK